jgi:hypothetical protein
LFGEPEQEEEEGRGGDEGGDASIAELQHTCRTMLASQSLLLGRIGAVINELISHRTWGYNSISDFSASLAVASRLDSMLEDLVTDATCAADAIHAALVPHTPQAYEHDTVATSSAEVSATKGRGSADTIATRNNLNGSTKTGGSGVVRPRERLESEIELLRGRLQSGVIRLTLSLQRMHAGEGEQKEIKKEMEEDLRYV